MSVSNMKLIYEWWYYIRTRPKDHKCLTADGIPQQMCLDTLLWRHNGRDGVSNHQPHDCLLNRSFGRRSKKKSKLRVTDLCAGKSPVPGEFPAQMASDADNVFIWWRHHEHGEFLSFFLVAQQCFANYIIATLKRTNDMKSIISINTYPIGSAWI